MCSICENPCENPCRILNILYFPNFHTLSIKVEGYLSIKYPSVIRMAPTVQTVLLTQKGELKQTKLPSKDVTIEIIQKLLKSKESELVATYQYANNYLYLFGAIDGKTGTENQHELPPPHDSILVFGDILLVASAEKNFSTPVAFTTLNYEKFYQYIFEEGEEEEDPVGGEEEVVAEDEEGVEDEEEVAEEEENEEEEGGNDGDEDGEDIISPVVKAPSKKKPTSAAIAFANSARGKQQTLMQTPGFKELDINSISDNVDGKKKLRAHMRTVIASNITGLTPIELEDAIYKGSIKEADKLHVICHWDNPLFENIYKTVARRVITNLSSNSYIQNSRLLERILDKEFTLEELVLKNSYELFPEQWKELSDRQIMREQKLLEGNKGMATNQFKCHGCGKRESTYYEMQTRSADEPMTIFITCLNCGKRWRQ